jgi:hypothetical protein
VRHVDTKSTYRPFPNWFRRLRFSSLDNLLALSILEMLLLSAYSVRRFGNAMPLSFCSLFPLMRSTRSLDMASSGSIELMELLSKTNEQHPSDEMRKLTQIQSNDGGQTFKMLYGVQAVIAHIEHLKPRPKHIRVRIMMPRESDSPATRGKVHVSHAVALKAELDQAIEILQAVRTPDLVVVCTQFA